MVINLHETKINLQKTASVNLTIDEAIAIMNLIKGMMHSKMCNNEKQLAIISHKLYTAIDKEFSFGYSDNKNRTQGSSYHN